MKIPTIIKLQHQNIQYKIIIKNTNILDFRNITPTSPKLSELMDKYISNAFSINLIEISSLFHKLKKVGYFQLISRLRYEPCKFLFILHIESQLIQTHSLAYKK